MEGQTLELDELRSALEQTQEELTREQQRADEAETVPRGRSNDELEQVQKSLKAEKKRVR